MKILKPNKTVKLVSSSNCHVFQLSILGQKLKYFMSSAKVRTEAYWKKEKRMLKSLNTN